MEEYNNKAFKFEFTKDKTHSFFLSFTLSSLHTHTTVLPVLLFSLTLLSLSPPI